MHASTMSPVVNVCNISVATQQTTILSNLSFCVEQPCFVAILGKSGIGKSTLLGVLAGIVPICSGSISLPSSSISLMTQQDSLLPWKNVTDNVTLGYQLRKQYQPRIRERALTLLDIVEMRPHAKTYPHTLSGGMKQRVMLARTLLEDTAVVLMDEPFSALDAINRHKTGLLAHKLLQGRTTIMVTHDPLEALRLADQIYLMTSPAGTLTPVDMPTATPPRDHHHEEVITCYQTILQQLIS